MRQPAFTGVWRLSARGAWAKIALPRALIRSRVENMFFIMPRGRGWPAGAVMHNHLFRRSHLIG
ncbi:hypothetical protein B0W47_02510 [Komagataeibacter nataicola]|uniref:Uncharacterized protein n=1 Tax=Komagataeibacter nataicola TaxID=265960 RepID=A0A9N7C6Q3_9PROT|nr:hypothetical protein B0W47_02510 [Komagataeibacter nataicola]PYD66375.1 hypothetical protein CDI09_08765 [Komagataeibacter nataicola]